VAAWVASQQLSLITARQLQEAALGRNAIARRRQKGILRPVHHGVYLFGAAPLLPGARELAAVLASGDSALVSHRSAAALWRIAAPAEDDVVDITVVGSRRRPRDGIVVHRTPAIDPADRALLRGIPITSPARTVLDFAAGASSDELERGIAEAYALRLTTEAELKRTIERNPHRAGVAALKAELRREGGPAWTRLEGERRMKLLIRQAQLPAPLANIKVAGYKADFLWPAERLIVEVDGYQFHGHRQAFERDRRRDAAHVLAGYRVIRITWRRLTDEPLAVAAIIAGALSASRSPG
jgi:very-short-patch-repair endonuclease